MDHEALLARISARISELGTTHRAVSIEATGSADTIRNWQRRHQKGEVFSMRQASLDAVANVLGVSSQWLMSGDDEPASGKNTGLAEETAPYQVKPSQSEAVKVIYAATAKRAEVARRMTISLPTMGLEDGDLLVCDIGREARPGDTVMVHIADGKANGTTVIRRWHPPWLLSGVGNIDANPMRDDQFGVTVQFPVIGSIRGA